MIHLRQPMNTKNNISKDKKLRIILIFLTIMISCDKIDNPVKNYPSMRNKVLLSTTIELEWVAEHLIMDINISKNKTKYILKIEEKSSNLSLSKKEILSRKAQCFCSGIRNSVGKRKISIEISETDAINFINKLKQILSQKDLNNSSYCANYMGSHFSFFSGKIYIFINSKEPIKINLYKKYVPYLNKDILRNCDLIIDGPLLAKKDYFLIKWRKLLEIFHDFIKSRQIVVKLNELKFSGSKISSSIFQGFFNGVLVQNCIGTK